TLCKSKRIAEPCDFFNSLKEKGIKANEVIRTTLIDGNYKVEKPDEKIDKK
ncbi:unnamed protein product, partial [Dovyalis caffra]